MTSRDAATSVNLTIALITIMACLAVFVYASMFIYAGPEHTLLGLACLSSVFICLLPFWLRRESDIFQPLGYILVLTIIAMPLRHTYLMLSPADDEDVLSLTNHQPMAFFIPGALMVNLALAGLACGYLCTTHRIKIERVGIFRSASWRSRTGPPWS